MTHFDGEFKLPPTHLVTDLDGTYLPLPDHPEHHVDLKVLTEKRSSEPFGLVFCTGRHFESVREVMDELSLANPDWIICDVGTSIYHLEQGHFKPYTPYRDHLTAKVGEQQRAFLVSVLEPVGNLTLQCEAHQGTFKISFECETQYTDSLVNTIASLLEKKQFPYEVHGSIDPFLNCGLIDVLPKGVSKAYAVSWLSSHADFDANAVIYSGDSGNDLTALTAGFRAILVANHSEGLDQQVEARLGDTAEHLLFKATKTATSGVLEGCRHFGLLS